MQEEEASRTRSFLAARVCAATATAASESGIRGAKSGRFFLCPYHPSSPFNVLSFLTYLLGLQQAPRSSTSQSYDVVCILDPRAPSR